MQHCKLLVRATEKARPLETFIRVRLMSTFPVFAGAGLLGALFLFLVYFVALWTIIEL